MEVDAKARIEKSITDLCTEAYKLKLLLRRFPEEIDFKIPDPEDEVNQEDFLIMHFEGTELPSEPRVLFTLLGGLVKFPLEGGRIILERPTVVVAPAATVIEEEI